MSAFENSYFDVDEKKLILIKVIKYWIIYSIGLSRKYDTRKGNVKMEEDITINVTTTMMLLQCDIVYVFVFRMCVIV